jgi:16S rRNA processing protein RimM
MTARKRAMKTTSGSPPPGEPEYLLVGTIRRPHGVHGELLMDVATDFPERLQPGVKIFVGAAHVPTVIAACRGHARGLLLTFEGVDTPESAGMYRNETVWVLAADRPPLPEGQYYHHELLGCTIEDEKRGSIGILAEILLTGANDVYVVQTPEGREVLLPAIAGVVLHIDVPNRIIRIRVPEGIEIDDSA